MTDVGIESTTEAMPLRWDGYGINGAGGKRLFSVPIGMLAAVSAEQIGERIVTATNERPALLARVARLLRDIDIAAKLRASRDAQALYAVLALPPASAA